MKYRLTWIRNDKIYIRKDEFKQALPTRTNKSEDSLCLNNNYYKVNVMALTPLQASITSIKMRVY